MASNTVFEENTFTAPSEGATNIMSPGTVTVEHDAFIVGTGDNGLEFFSGPNKIKVDGYIQTDKNGIALYDVTSNIANSTLTVGTEGAIFGGAGFSGVSTAMAVDIINSGTIQGGDYGIKYAGITHSTTKAITITNNAGGEIRGSKFGIYVDDGNHDLIVKNAGVIDEVSWIRGSKITNSGSMGILNQVTGEDFDNSITNSGHIFGSVSLGAGDDSVTNSGSINGAVELFNGNNKVTNSGGIGAYISAAGGNDTVTNSGNISGSIDLGSGVSNLINSGHIGGAVDFGTGDFKFTNSGDIDGLVTIASGTGTFINSGTIDQFFEIDGGASITLTNSGIMKGVAVTGPAAKIANSGLIASPIEGGFSDHDLTIINSGTVSGNILTFAGLLKVTNSGTISGGVVGNIHGDVLGNTKLITGDVELFDGDNVVTNSGTISGHLSTGVGDDTVTNTKIIDDHVNLGEGDNTLTNSGTIFGEVTTGGGDDVYKNTGQVGLIQLGGGDDKFTGGNFEEFVDDASGNDQYNFGGGNDTFFWEAQGADTIDGGAGTLDTFSAQTISHGVVINLDTKAVKIGTTEATGSTAFFDVFNDAKIKGFEVAVGSNYADFIAGGNASEDLRGGKGADVLYGGGGKDTLSGGSDADTFVYLSTKDSGNTIATRDTITDFTTGDRINLDAIDANTKTKAEDDFHLIGLNGKFDATPGGLRWLHENTTTGPLTIIQGDVNGDGKADFSIAVVGTLSFTGADFDL